MALLDLQAMEPAGGYEGCNDRCHEGGGSEISLLICG